MTYTTIAVQKEGTIWTVGLNRPEHQNKLSISCMDELVQLLNDAEKSKECRSIVLHGNSDWFCAGGDLGDYRKKTVAEIKEFGEAFIKLHLAIRNSKIPVIAAVEGKAHGGGCSLVEVCDLAVASGNAEFAVPEILSGLAPAMGFSGLFANVGKKDAFSLGILGEKLDAKKAKELGLVNYVVPEGQVYTTAAEIAKKISSYDPICISLFKEMYTDMDQRAYENRLHIGQAMMIALFKAKGEENEAV